MTSTWSRLRQKRMVWMPRSEERRVGKECRSRWSPYDEKKKEQVKYVVGLAMLALDLANGAAATYVAALDVVKNPAGIFFFPAEDGIRVGHVTGVQTCALPI